MIKTLSPYYIYVPLISPSTGLIAISYRLEIYLWTGSKLTPSVTPIYTKTIDNAALLTDTHRINISNLVNDFIDFEPQQNFSTAFLDSPNQRWVKTQVFYTTSEPTESTVAQSITADIIVAGWSYGNEGENKQTPIDKILVTGREFEIGREGLISLPVELGDPVPPPNIELVITDVVNTGGSNWNVEFTIVGIYEELKVKVFPSVGLAEVFTLSGLTSPQAIVVNFFGQPVGITINGFEFNTFTTILSNTFNIAT